PHESRHRAARAKDGPDNSRRGVWPPWPHDEAGRDDSGLRQLLELAGAALDRDDLGLIRCDIAGGPPSASYGAVWQVENSDVSPFAWLVAVAVTTWPDGTAVTPVEKVALPLPSVVASTEPRKV